MHVLGVACIYNRDGIALYRIGKIPLVCVGHVICFMGVRILLELPYVGAKVQLIIDKEKEIYLRENLFFLQYRFFNQPDS